MNFVAYKPIQFKNKLINPGDTFTVKDEAAIKHLIKQGKIRPLKYELNRLFDDHMKNLKQGKHTLCDIRAVNPFLADEIVETVRTMDIAYDAEDLNAFKGAINKTEKLYFSWGGVGYEV